MHYSGYLIDLMQSSGALINWIQQVCQLPVYLNKIDLSQLWFIQSSFPSELSYFHQNPLPP